MGGRGMEGAQKVKPKYSHNGFRYGSVKYENKNTELENICNRNYKNWEDDWRNNQHNY